MREMVPADRGSLRSQPDLKTRNKNPSMNTTRLEVLLGLYFDGEISNVEMAELDACLKADPEARSLFLSHAEVHSALRAVGARGAGMRQWQAAASVPAPLSSPVRRAASALWNPWIAAAAGLLIGLTAGSSGLISRGFRAAETGVDRLAFGRGGAGEMHEVLPNAEPLLVTEVALSAEGWEGSFREAVGKDRCERGSGESYAHMFRMAAREANADGERAVRSGYLKRLVDLRPYREGFSDGKASIQLSGFLNAVGEVPKQGEFCSVAIYALDKAMLEKAILPSGDLKEDALMVAKKETRILDADPVTWEPVLAELALPSSAEYLVVRIDVGAAADSGVRYLDDIRLDITRSEPMH